MTSQKRLNPALVKAEADRILDGLPHSQLSLNALHQASEFVRLDLESTLSGLPYDHFEAHSDTVSQPFVNL